MRIFGRMMLFIGYKSCTEGDARQMRQREESLSRVHSEATRQIRAASERQKESSIGLQSAAAMSTKTSRSTRELVKGVLENLEGWKGEE